MQYLITVVCKMHNFVKKKINLALSQAVKICLGISVYGTNNSKRRGLVL